MSRHPHPSNPRRALSSAMSKAMATTAIPWIGLAIAILITFGIWRTVQKDSQELAQSHFSAQAERVQNRIMVNMRTNERLLLGGVGLFEANAQVSRDAWHGYVQTLQPEANYPWVLGIGFTLRVRSDQLRTHVAQIRSEGFTNYIVWPAGERSEYFPIIYLEAFRDRKLRAFGYDMFSEPVLHAAMAHACDEGRAVLSDVITLGQEIPNRDLQKGLVMYLPVFAFGSPHDTLAQRRAALIGYSYSPLCAADFFDELLFRDHLGVGLKVYDGTNAIPEHLIYVSQSHPGDPAVPGKHLPLFNKTARIDFYGQTWTAVFHSLPSFEAAQEKPNEILIVAGGSLLSLLFFSLALSYVSRYRAHRLLTVQKQHLQIMLDHCPVSIWFKDRQGRFIRVNPAAAALTGMGVDQIEGKTTTEVFPQEADIYLADDREVMSSERAKLGMVEPVTTASGLRWVQTDKVPWRDESGQIAGVIAFAIDITERKLAEEKIQSSLREKEVLLKEVHHRVKNNLQIISSLLDLQAAAVEDSTLLWAFKESQLRVKTMALVHEKLYQSTDLAQIDFAAYTESLSHNLLRAYSGAQSRVAIKLSIEKVFLKLDAAIPCALIVNELVSNALKYAFPPDFAGEDKTIHIGLDRKQEGWTLFVNDNGVGLPSGLEVADARTLGFQMIVMLTRQLRGTLQVQSQPGTRFSILFKAL